MPLDTAPLLPPFGTVHPPLLSSVFFTDPPTPAIYTLSLHDALPILRVRGPRGLRRGGTARRLEPRSVVDRSDSRLLLPDRKSTRLNSSHTVISYAVFCLKKKNEKRQRNHPRSQNTEAKCSDILVPTL